MIMMSFAGIVMGQNGLYRTTVSRKITVQHREEKF